MVGLNTVVRLAGIYHAIGWNSSKMTITSKGRPSSTYPLRLFLVYMSPIYRQKNELKSSLSVGELPSSVLDFSNFRVFRWREKKRKITITFGERGLSANPFRLYTISIFSTDWHVNEGNRRGTPRTVPSSATSWILLFESNSYLSIHLSKKCFF